MDFFLNWCINCGKRSEYLYCCNECRINDLKRNKTSCNNDNNYTLEFKNRKHYHSSSYYQNKNIKNMSPVSPSLMISIPDQTTNNPNESFSSSSSRSSSCSDLSPVGNSTTNRSNALLNPMALPIYSSPPNDVKPQRPRYYVQTFHNLETSNNQSKQILTPLSEKDNMEYDYASNDNLISSQMSPEVNENSSLWYWSSSDDEEDY